MDYKELLELSAKKGNRMAKKFIKDKGKFREMTKIAEETRKKSKVEKGYGYRTWTGL